VSEFPAPLPWLERAGKVPPLDFSASAGRMIPAAELLRREAPTAEPLASDGPAPVASSGQCGCGKAKGACSSGGSKAAISATPAAANGTTTAALNPSAPLRADAKPPAPPAKTPVKPPKAGAKRPGSGIPARPIIRRLVWARRIAQVGFLFVFLWFLCATAFRGTFTAGAETPVRLPWPVEAFLLADPFVAAMTLLSTHTVYRGLAWSLAIVLLTVVFGRVFCGWICPFGTLHHFFGWIFPSRYLRGGRRVEANKTHGWQRAKYYLMWGFLAAALGGSVIGGLFDPICIAVRAIGLGVLPALQYFGVRGSTAIADSNVRSLQTAADSAQDVLARSIWTGNQAYFHQTWLIVFLLAAILFMNRIVPRFWCRALCPLGAFLGVMSRFSLFGMVKDHAKCTDCNLCLVHCQGADSPQGGVKHRKDECHMCLNCENACPEDVIKFRFLPGLRGTVTKPDLERRTVVTSAAAGLVAVPAMRIANWPDRAYSEKVIRPPGAVEEREFLERCIRCAECMKVCPNNALHPAFFEAGMEGLWTPILIPRIGYCEFSCVLCGQVCPTGAIQKIDEKQKMGVGQKPISIGTAMYDQGRCLPWSMATPCIVCEEFCPTSPKAIWAEEVEVPKRDDKYTQKGEHAAMLMVKVQRPHVDPSLCIGCGACEKVCPIVDKPAVYVTNAGETRSKTNVILLENTSYGQG
jgi:polyferredoxin